MKHLPLLILLLMTGWQANAQQKKAKPYLYLEVHKELPVQVKLNGKPVPNNRKGYIIIPRIAQGDNQLDFSFTNPNYKKHSFTVNSKAGKSLGLKLVRVSNNKFVLQNVVSKQIYTNNATLNAKPILASNTSKPTHKEKVKSTESETQRGIIKVYRAGEKNTKNEVVQTKKETKTVQTSIKKKKIVSTVQNSSTGQTRNSPATPKKKTMYAMYRYRKPLTEQEAQKRYKDYGKARRARKRSSVTQKNQKTVAKEKSSLKNEKNKAKELKQQERERRERELILKEKNLQEKLEQQKELRRQEKEIERAKKQRQRELKRIQAEREEAKRQKQIRLEKEKKKNAKQASKIQNQRKNSNVVNTDKKIINSEPVNIKAKNKNNEMEEKVYPFRCKNVVNQERVAEWMMRINKKFDDEARTNYIKRKLGNKCISTNNIGLLLGNMETQIGRYKMIRTFYPQLEDRANLDRLYKYFQSKSYVNKLKELSKQNIY